MREIKFRGQINNVITNNEGNVIKEFKSWVYGDLLHRPNGVLHLLTLKDEGFYENNVIDPDTIGQFTGLKDKSGKEIYEGDILNNGQRNYAVYWNSERGAWWLKNKDLIYTTPLRFLSIEQFVIGSVYDNPELLKGGSNEE